MKLMKLTPEMQETIRMSLMEQLSKELSAIDTTGVVKMQYNVTDLLQVSNAIIKPKVVISALSWVKLRQLTLSYKHEVAAHGLVKRKGNTYLIYDILIYPQLTNASHVESDEDLYADWLMDLEDDQINNMRFQYHSHGSMGIGPSGTDINYYETMVKAFPDFYIFMIGGNKETEYNIWVYDKEQNTVFEPKDVDVFIDTTSRWLSDNDKHIAPMPAPAPVTGINNYVNKYPAYTNSYVPPSSFKSYAEEIEEYDNRFMRQAGAYKKANAPSETQTFDKRTKAYKEFIKKTDPQPGKGGKKK